MSAMKIFMEFLTTSTAAFPEIFNGAFVPIDPVFLAAE